MTQGKPQFRKTYQNEPFSFFNTLASSKYILIIQASPLRAKRGGGWGRGAPPEGARSAPGGGREAPPEGGAKRPPEGGGGAKRPHHPVDGHPLTESPPSHSHHLTRPDPTQPNPTQSHPPLLSDPPLPNG